MPERPNEAKVEDVPLAVVAALLDRVRSGDLEPLALAGGAEAAAAAALASADPEARIFAPERHALAVGLARGLGVDGILAAWLAQGAGGREGPLAVYDRARGLYVPSGPKGGAYLTHAVGYGWAARIAGGKDHAVALFGARELAMAETHNALNFAGVMRPRTLLVLVTDPSTSLQGPAIADAYGLTWTALPADREAWGDALRGAASRLGGANRAELLSGSYAGDAESPPVDEAIRAEVEAALERRRAAPPRPREELAEGVFDRVPRHLVEELRWPR